MKPKKSKNHSPICCNSKEIGSNQKEQNLLTMDNGETCSTPSSDAENKNPSDSFEKLKIANENEVRRILENTIYFKEAIKKARQKEREEILKLLDSRKLECYMVYNQWWINLNQLKQELEE